MERKEDQDTIMEQEEDYENSCENEDEEYERKPRTKDQKAINSAEVYEIYQEYIEKRNLVNKNVSEYDMYLENQFKDIMKPQEPQFDENQQSSVHDLGLEDEQGLAQFQHELKIQNELFVQSSVQEKTNNRSSKKRIQRQSTIEQVIQNSSIEEQYSKDGSTAGQTLLSTLNRKEMFKDWAMILIPVVKKFIYKFIYRNSDDLCAVNQEIKEQIEKQEQMEKQEKEGFKTNEEYNMNYKDDNQNSLNNDDNDDDPKCKFIYDPEIDKKKKYIYTKNLSSQDIQQIYMHLAECHIKEQQYIDAYNSVKKAYKYSYDQIETCTSSKMHYKMKKLIREEQNF